MKSLCHYICILVAFYTVYGQITLPIYHKPETASGGRRRLTGGGSTAIREYIDFVPYTSLAIGSSNQIINGILIDTGSSPLWVQSDSCKTGCWNCATNKREGTSLCRGATASSSASNTCDFLKSLGGSPQFSPTCTGATYKPAISTSYHSNGTLDPFVIQYGDGSTYIGQYVSDTISLGPAVYDGFTFALVTQESYGGGSIDGILGLAPPEYNTASTLLTYMSQDTNMTTKQFSFYYPDQLPGTGELYIGGANPDLYTGNITWVYTYFSKYWKVIGDRVYAESIDGRTSGPGAAAIIDTGTSYLVGPHADIQAIATWLGLSYDAAGGRYYGLCSHVNNLPNFYISFGLGEKLLFNTTDNFNGGEYGTDSSGNVVCSVNMMAGSDASPRWIIGSVFLRQYYTIFDFTNYIPSTNLQAFMGLGKVGFAEKVKHASVTTFGKHWTELAPGGKEKSKTRSSNGINNAITWTMISVITAGCMLAILVSIAIWRNHKANKSPAKNSGESGNVETAPRVTVSV